MRAVLLATTPGAVADAGGETVASRLARQLRGHGVLDIVVVTRAEYRSGLPGGVGIEESSGVREDLRLLATACRGTEPVLVACADTLLGDTAVSTVLSDPTRRSGVLVGNADESRPLDAPVHRDRGLVLSVGTRFHEVARPNGATAGLLKVSAPYLDDLSTAMDRLVSEATADLAPGTDAWTLTVLALVRQGTKLTGYAVPGLEYGRVAGDAGARRLLADITAADEDAVRFDLCVKRDDDMFATYCVSSWSRTVVRACRRLRLTPVGVTWLSILFALVAAAGFAHAERWSLIGGAVAMYVSFLFDCVDGQLARYTHRFSAFGGWLDMIADRGKEYLVYAGLAWGASNAGLTWAWPLAITAMSVQTVRHMTDTWYGTMQDAASLRTATRPLAEAADGFAPATDRTGGSGSLAVRLGRTLGKLSAQFTAQRRSPAYWFKRTIVFPVGERWLVMAVAVAIFDGRVALAALLVGQLIALAYTLAGRTLRSWAAKVPVLAREDVSTHRDDGVVVRVLRELGLPPLGLLAVVLPVDAVALVLTLTVDGAGVWPALGACLVSLLLAFSAGNRHAAALDWLVPAGFRAVECLLVITCGLGAGVPLPLIFGLLGALVIYHYDLAARVDKAASPLDSRAWGLGWDGRVVVLLVSLIPGAGVVVFAVLTALLAAVFLVGAVLGSARSRAA